MSFFQEILNSIKPPVTNGPPLSSLEEVSILLSELSLRTAELKKIEGQHAEEMVVLNQKYTEKGRACAVSIRVLEARIEEYATANREELLADNKKSVSTQNGEFGWSKNPDRLSLPKTVEEPDLCYQLIAAGLDAYVQTTPRVLKDRVKQDFSKYEEQFKELGLRVAKGNENFFIKPVEVRLA
jgi:phage host-nuclease inhibitor protein Gam